MSRLPLQPRWLPRWPAGLLLLAALLFLAGCASRPAQYPALIETPGELPRSVELSEVPFFPQDDYQCGPAAMATVMSHLGVPTRPDELTPRMYLPERQGSLQPELLGATRSAGLVAYRHEPRLRHVLGEVAAGHPVLVMQNLGLERFPVWHYAVIVGYDLDRREVILRSGTVEREVMSLRGFERSWRLADHWALTVHQPGDFPHHADARRYLESVSALEAIGRLDPAERAYDAAADRWPDNAVAWLGLGNTRYRTGRYREAERAYREAVAADPDNPAGHHNLAWALIRQHREDEAFPSAYQAARLAGDAGRHYWSALETLEHNDNARESR